MAAITVDEIQSLCGRPRAFVEVASLLLSRTDPGHQEIAGERFARGAQIEVDRSAGTTWWLWPWDPDQDLDGEQPWSRVRREDLIRQRGGPLGCRPHAADHNREGVLRVALARTPRDPEAWADALAQWLRPQVDRRDLRVELILPTELARRAAEVLAIDEIPWLRSGRALAARAHPYSASERDLMAALDRSHEDSIEHWTVVADELQGRGDPLGESLALAVAAQVGIRDRNRVAQALARREAERQANADKLGRLLPFANERGCSFDVSDFLSPPEIQDDGYEARPRVQLWASRFGPFVTRLLASSDYGPWRGLGLPEELLAAPELRYLSPKRMNSIAPEGADLSGCDLAAFEFTHLHRVGPKLTAVEASLRGCDLRQTDLSGFFLDGADLRGADSDLGTKISGASFVEARVSPRLQRRLQSWNGGLFRLQRGQPADVRGLQVGE